MIHIYCKRKFLYPKFKIIIVRKIFYYRCFVLNMIRSYTQKVLRCFKSRRSACALSNQVNVIYQFGFGRIWIRAPESIIYTDGSPSGYFTL